MKQLSLLIILISMLLVACETPLDLSQVDFDGPPTVIYKTKSDYSPYVPVVLNNEKTAIVAYPAPGDLYDKAGKLRFPTELDKGYYLDEIGVGLNTAYISITLDKYSHMLSVPSIDSLFNLVIEDDPFTKMYNLGNRKQYLNLEKVREILSSGDYKQYERLK